MRYSRECTIKSVLYYPPSDKKRFEVIALDDLDELITLIWNGRNSIPGIELGAKVRIAGVICKEKQLNFQRVIFNPEYTLL